MIICVSGLSGAGKTTFVKGLTYYLNQVNLKYLHINSDMLSEKIYAEKYGNWLERDIDYTNEELSVIYASMFEVIKTAVSNNRKLIVITDGMYRKNSQRIVLEKIASDTQVPFIFVKIELDFKAAKKRIDKRLKEKGFGGWVDPAEYEDVQTSSTFFVRNNNSEIELKKKAKEFVDRLFLKYV